MRRRRALPPVFLVCYGDAQRAAARRARAYGIRQRVSRYRGVWRVSEVGA